MITLERPEPESIQSTLSHLSPRQASASLDALHGLRGAFIGKTGYVLASGPSLKELPIEKLPPYHTICVNYSVLAIETPFWATINDEVWLYTLFEKATNVFTTSGKVSPNAIYTEDLGPSGWCSDLTKGVYTNGTTTLSALAAAVHLGFNPIYMVGFDLCKAGDQTHFFGKTAQYDRDLAPFVTLIRSQLRNIIMPALAKEGVEVYNTSPYKAFDEIPYREFPNA